MKHIVILLLAIAAMTTESAHAMKRCERTEEGSNKKQKLSDTYLIVMPDEISLRTRLERHGLRCFVNETNILKLLSGKSLSSQDILIHFLNCQKIFRVKFLDRTLQSEEGKRANALLIEEQFIRVLKAIISEPPIVAIENSTPINVGKEIQMPKREEIETVFSKLDLQFFIEGSDLIEFLDGNLLHVYEVAEFIDDALTVFSDSTTDLDRQCVEREKIYKAIIELLESRPEDQESFKAYLKRVEEKG